MGSIIMDSSRALVLLAVVLNIFLFLIGGSGALRGVELITPKYLRRGEDVKLICNYDQERDQIYMVNWYKGKEEFYRYIPKEAPPQKAFPQAGFNVDVRRSSDHEVYLRNVSLESSGLYKCSASAEQTFQTLSSTSEMIVVVIGDDMPSVQLDRAQYHPGDPVTVECQSPFSYPPANITWFYNDTEVGPEHDIKTESKKSNTDPMTQARISRFSFDLPIPEKLPVSTVSIKCRVMIFTLYDQNSTIQTIAPIARRLTGTDTLLRPGSSSSSPSLMASPGLPLLFSATIFTSLRTSNWLLSLLLRPLLLLHSVYYSLQN